MWICTRCEKSKGITRRHSLNQTKVPWVVAWNVHSCLRISVKPAKRSRFVDGDCKGSAAAGDFFAFLAPCRNTCFIIILFQCRFSPWIPTIMSVQCFSFTSDCMSVIFLFSSRCISQSSLSVEICEFVLGICCVISNIRCGNVCVTKSSIVRDLVLHNLYGWLSWLVSCHFQWNVDTDRLFSSISVLCWCLRLHPAVLNNLLSTFIFLELFFSQCSLVFLFLGDLVVSTISIGVARIWCEGGGHETKTVRATTWSRMSEFVRLWSDLKN